MRKNEKDIRIPKLVSKQFSPLVTLVESEMSIIHSPVAALLLVIAIGCFVASSGLAEEFHVADHWPESVLVFAADRDHVLGHSNGIPRGGSTDTDMYHSYREPVAVQTKTDRIVCLCHAGNRFSWPERSGQDFTVSYSDDGGRTWSAPSLVAEHGNYSMQSHGLVYDVQVDQLHCLYTVYRWDYSLAKGRGVEASAPVIKAQLEAGEDLHRQYIVSSKDGGETWSEPRDISAIMPEQDSNGHFGSSEGRQLTIGPRAGRLLVPGGLRAEDNERDVIRKSLFVWISDDHGKTWRASEPLLKTTATREYSCEARVTELSDGTLLYNLRTRNLGRHLARSSDAGETWSALEPEEELRSTQCNGSMITLRENDGQLTRTIMCSLPLPGGRNQGVIYVSYDDGHTWPRRHDLIPGFFAYSCLIQIDSKSVGLFYEANHYRDICFIRLPIDRLTQLGKATIP
jgi:sialidase-1